MHGKNQYFGVVIRSVTLHTHPNATADNSAQDMTDG